MSSWFAVTRIQGPAWDKTKPMRSQVEWDEHAKFMNQLAADGFVVLGGPLDTGDTLLIINAADENEIRTTLAHDNWSELNLLEIQSIQRWTILLQAPKNGE